MSGAECAHGLPKDESVAAAFAVKLSWDTAKSSSSARIENAVVRGTAVNEAWARAAEGFSAGRAFWRLKYDAKGTNKKGGLGVVAEEFSDVDDYTPNRQNRLWVFTNGPEGSAYAEGRDVTDEGLVRSSGGGGDAAGGGGDSESESGSDDEEDLDAMMRKLMGAFGGQRPGSTSSKKKKGGGGARFFDYYDDEVGVLLDCDQHALGIYRSGKLQCVIKNLPAGETFHPAVAVNCKHHTYTLSAVGTSRQVRVLNVCIAG